MLELFLIEYTTGRGLGIACNTLKMLVEIELRKPILMHFEKKELRKSVLCCCINE
jgi:hypothetical protein